MGNWKTRCIRRFLHSQTSHVWHDSWNSEKWERLAFESDPDWYIRWALESWLGSDRDKVGSERWIDKQLIIREDMLGGCNFGHKQEYRCRRGTAIFKISVNNWRTDKQRKNEEVDKPITWIRSEKAIILKRNIQSLLYHSRNRQLIEKITSFCLVLPLKNHRPPWGFKMGRNRSSEKNQLYSYDANDIKDKVNQKFLEEMWLRWRRRGAHSASFKEAGNMQGFGNKRVTVWVDVLHAADKEWVDLQRKE